MRKIAASVAAVSLLMFSGLANADVAQVWVCKIVEGKTYDDAMDLSKKWLDAAKSMNDNAQARVYWPVAGQSDQGSFVFVFYLPDFKTWGEFEDAYPDSPAADVDAGWDAIAPCEKVSSLYATTLLE